MATIDDSRGVLVVRIVYDGPALSGKTTSLRALSRGVACKIDSQEEKDGRTLFFDWVDYVGGLFEGRQIRCQIVSVPGQRELMHRRKLLLASADAVVLVLDTSQHEWEFGRNWLKETLEECRSREPPVGLVLQANKRDAEAAVPRETLRESLASLPPVAMVESSAVDGDGIRETFVLAVRLALDRVRALSASGRLSVGRPSEDAPDELLAKLLAAEGERTALEGSFAASAGAAIQAELAHWIPELASVSPRSSSDPSEEETLFVPDPMMPGGMIWPPVDGRVLLHEVSSCHILPARTARADWWGAESGFRLHSARTLIFHDPHEARTELIEWARLHAANASYVSAGRAVILADAGNGRLRLWQIVRSEATLRERLSMLLSLPEPAGVARELVGVAVHLVRSRDAFSRATVPLPCTLWTLGANDLNRATFVGLMPPRHSLAASTELEGAALLAREFTPHLRELRRSRVDYAEVASQVTTLAKSTSREAPALWLADLFAAMYN